MKKIRDLFNLDMFKNCRVVCGEKGLNRGVDFVNISDTHDIASLLKKNDLLLTTGYGFKDNPLDLVNFINKLHSIGVSGLIIKENRFIHNIPNQVVELCNNIDFPILFLSGTNTLGELSYQITGYLSDYKCNELSHAIHLQKQFTNMMLKNYNIDYLVHKLSLTIDSPVILLSNKLSIISPSKNLSSTHANLVNQIIDLIKSNYEYYHSCTNEYIKDPLTLDKVTFSTFIVPTIYHLPSILVILNSDKLIHPLSNTSIEQIIYALSFCIIKQQMIFENKLRIKSSLFLDLLYGNIENTSIFFKKASIYGLKENCKYMCITGSFDLQNPYETYQSISDNKLTLNTMDVVENLENESKILNLDIIVFTQKNHFVIINQIDKDNDNSKNSVENLLSNVQKNFECDMSISFGLSSYFNSINQTRNAYLDSIEALNSGYDLGKSNFIQHYLIKDISDIINLIPQRTLKSFSSNILGNIINSSSQEKHILIDTLKAFINNKYDISKTSRELYIHRNTVKYRLSRCEELLNMSLSDSRDCFIIQFALEVNNILYSK